MAQAQGVHIVVEGAGEIARALKGLPRKIQNQVLRQAIRLALKPVLAAAKANAPRDTGELVRTLVIRAVKGKRRGEIALQVITDPKRFDGVPHAAAVEFGTSEVEAQPFMAITFAETSDAALATAEQQILAGIERLVLSS
jgi:HK97 gp10 family phage protein